MAELKHDIELIDYIDVVLKHKWFILLATLACTAGALWQTGNTITQYQASALLFAKGNSGAGTAASAGLFVVNCFRYFLLLL